MSATTKNNKNQQPAVITTGRGAAAAITFGITLLTLGLALLLSKMVAGESYALREFSRFMEGLAGTLWLGVPLLLCWGGAKLLVSARHRVSGRDFGLLLCIYLLVLGICTLTARVSEAGSSYMDYLGRIQDERSLYASNTFSTYLRRAYQLGRNGAGGWLGMLIAYPVWQVARTVLGTVFLAVLLIALLFVLFRINPGKMLRKATTSKTEQPKPTKAAVPAPKRNEAPTVSEQEAQRQAPVYSVPTESWAGEPAASYTQKEGFYSTQPNLYEEYFNTQPLEAVHPENAPEDGAQDPEETSRRPAQEMPERQPAAAAKADEPAKRTEKHVFRIAKTVLKKKDSAPTEEDNDLPWDENTPSDNVAERQSVAGNGSASSWNDINGSSVTPKQNDWAEQVRVRQNALESEKPAYSRHSVSTAAKQVYTDPVMPITKERIAIGRRDTEKRGDEKLDGTPAPKAKQTRMSLNAPYKAPPLRLLSTPKPVRMDDIVQEDQYRAGVIVNTLKSFKVDAIVRKITHGPSVTQFAIEIGQGIKVNRVTGLANNLALDMKVANIRMEQVQRTNLIGIEVPNMVVQPVTLLEVLDSTGMKNDPNPLLVALGKDIEGKPILCDLGAMPHLLIAGATGSGKSVCINSIICSLLYRASPEQVKLIMVDPKQVELAVYNDIPHLLLPVISDARKVSGALEWAVQEMEDRYSKFQQSKIRSLARYNNVFQGTDKVMPNIVIIIDEMADLMQVCGKEIEASIQRLSAKARAAGIYLVVATQRPSVKVITGDIKNNIPSRIAFAVASGTDSSTILDSYGAEKLIGRGDMLYKPQGTSPVRVQGCFTTDDEVIYITDYIKSHYEPEYDPDISETIEQLENAKKGKQKPDEISVGDDGGDGSVDDRLAEAIELAVDSGQISTSMLQRRLSIGYARAGRLVDEMEKRGIVSHSEGSKPRKTLMTREEYYENLADISDE